ncbi:MAG: AMP-binding protein [Phycisphaerales bacterium]|nr:MAG: AMP-binding protein [Phycisphaerales bacterium]
MLVDALLDANRKVPNKLAVSDGRLALNYRQLTRLARVMRSLVARETANQRVGIMLPCTALFPAALCGVLWSRKTAVPLNFLLGSGELADIVSDAGLDLVLTINHFKEIAEKLPARVVLIDELPLKRKVFFRLFTPIPAVPLVDPGDTAVLLYTSGTTAAPKGVELTYRNLQSNCVDSIETLNIDPNQTFLNILPPFHVFGLTALVLVPLFLRATVHAIPRFSPVSVVKAVERQRISIMMAIPSMYAAVLRTKSSTRDSFRSIYLAISGGEPLPDTVREGFEKRFGVTLREGYGLTETSPVISANSAEVYRQGSVGRPIRNAEVRIIDEAGNSLGPDRDGEIVVRGPCVMKGYYKSPEETRKVIDQDGWFHTGDIGRLDADGFLYITGRLKEMLIIGGENVFPREIEAVLEDHEGVLQAAVIGIPDESRGEAPIAFVLRREGASVTELQLRNHAKQTLAGYKVPKQVHIRDDLPTSPTGKILKRRLRELL